MDGEGRLSLSTFFVSRSRGEDFLDLQRNFADNILGFILKQNLKGTFNNSEYIDSRKQKPIRHSRNIWP
jgi:hypothetical protein